MIVKIPINRTKEKGSFFLYIKSYYRAFMKKSEVDKFPVFDIGE